MILAKKKKYLKRFMVMLAVVSMVFTNTLSTLSSITYAATTTEAKNPVLKKTNYREMLVGDSYDFNIANKQAGMKYKWTSSDKSIATVNRVGLVKAKSVGSADITCVITKEDMTYTLKAKVYIREESKNPAEEIIILDDITTMKQGYKFILNVTYSPTDAEDFINWTSSNTEIATINKYGVITAKTPGKVTINAKTLNKSVSDKVVITVLEEEVEDLVADPTPEPTVTPQQPTTTPPRPTTAPPKPTTAPPEPTTVPPEPTTVPPEPSPYPVDEAGFDPQGRMVANFGTPIIDGIIDDIWDKAFSVSPTVSTGSTDTTATFKTLWDDKGLYVLAIVKDSNLSSEASAVYHRDSIEIFLDENNEKTKTYEVDDLQFRVNYLNQQSSDRGDINRFYTSAKVIDDGYIIEARVAFQNVPENDKVLGFELAVNDALNGNRIATLNVYDQTGMAYDDTGLFGELVLRGKTNESVSGLNPYDLINLTKYADSIKLERYINGYVVEETIEEAELAIADQNTTQVQIDELYQALKSAIRGLIHTGESFDDKECRLIPSEYLTIDEHMGTIERLDYTTSTYDAENRTLDKYLNVYLPAGYDANDNSKKYDILYLIHGMGENQHTIFGGPGKNTDLMRIVDNMIAYGELEPMIIVTPTWYNDGNGNMFELVKNFHNELINDILPAVESKYNTYATSTSKDDLIASRDHRAFGGFSMGGGCTWYNYIYGLDYFKYYMPISMYNLADVSGLPYEGTDSQKNAQYLASIAKDKGYGPKDYYIYCATGTDDMAYNGMVPQIEAMKELTDSFIYSADLRKGNFYFLALEGGTHIWNCVNRYLYNMLPDLFLKDDPPQPSVDEKGFDSQGRMVANFATPIIDGDIDEVWENAHNVYPNYVGNNVETTATFKALWDDNAIYFLAEVKDNELSAQSGTPYLQDSFEVFLDENNDKSREYGVDDLHFRVNYENLQSIDNGNAERFYTATKIVDGGYIIESRVALNTTPVNGKVLGVDLQVNEAKGADRVGTINVFDATGTGWNDTSKFGEIVLLGKADGSTSGLNPYNLINLIKSARKLDLSLYSNFSKVIDVIEDAEALLGNNDLTQSELDEQYNALRTAIEQLVLTEDAANEKYFIPVPDVYRMGSSRPGNIVSLTYSAANASGGTDSKKLNVYLPHGYDDVDNTLKYNIFYLLHGGGENENTIFGGEGQSTELKKMIDNLIEKGDIEPMIIVTPTFNGGSGNVDTFHKEMINDIIPFVETTYRTYAGSATDEELKASRDHRAFGGFSMGSVCTWNNYINILDYVKYFVPLSGECWAIGRGGSQANETAEYLANIAKTAGYTPKDYYIFCATGNQDTAYPNMVPQMEAMRQLSDSFVYSSDTSKGNFYFMVAEGGTHNWNWVNQYIFNILPDLFCNTVPSPDLPLELDIDPIDEFEEVSDIAPDNENGSNPDVEDVNDSDHANEGDADDQNSHDPDPDNNEDAENDQGNDSDTENDEDLDTDSHSDSNDYIIN